MAVEGGEARQLRCILRAGGGVVVHVQGISYYLAIIELNLMIGEAESRERPERLGDGRALAGVRRVRASVVPGGGDEGGGIQEVPDHAGEEEGPTHGVEERSVRASGNPRRVQGRLECQPVNPITARVAGGRINERAPVPEAA